MENPSSQIAMLLTAFAAVALSGVAAVPAMAEVELTPFVGYRIGGEIDELSDSDASRPGLDFEVDEGTSFGLILGFPLGEHWQIELFFGHQETELLEERGVFSNSPLLDLDIDYYHLGFLYEWKPGQIHPFVGGSLGVGRLDPEPSTLDGETRFSVGLGGGIKILFNRNVGLRFEGRLFSILLDEEDDFGDCHHFDHCIDSYADDYLEQGEIRAGLILAF